MKKKILFLMFLLVMIIPFNVKAYCTADQKCKTCKDYTNQCAVRDEYGNTCEAKNGCSFKYPEKAIYYKEYPQLSCTDYDYYNCPNPGVDYYGNACKPITSGNSKECIKIVSPKNCGEIYKSTGNCPKRDDYGNYCNIGTYGSTCNISSSVKYKNPKVCENIVYDKECGGTDYKGNVCIWKSSGCYTGTKATSSTITKTPATPSNSSNPTSASSGVVSAAEDATEAIYGNASTAEASMSAVCSAMSGNTSACNASPYCKYSNGSCILNKSIISGTLNSTENTTNTEVKSFTSGGTIKACGVELPENLPGFTSKLYDIVKLMVPVVIIILGMFDFLKATMANKEENAKKEKEKFIRRLIAGVIIFFIMVAVEFVFNHIDVDEKNGMISCMKCILSNNCGYEFNYGEAKEYNNCEDYIGETCPEQAKSGQYCEETGGYCHVKCNTLGVSSCDDSEYCTYIYPNCVEKDSSKKQCSDYTNSVEKPCLTITDDYGQQCAPDSTETPAPSYVKCKVQ